MGVQIILLIASMLFFFSYFFWNRFSKTFKLNCVSPTPSIERYDRTNYVPAKFISIFGGHLGPSFGIGPVISSFFIAKFGSIPFLAWVVLGSCILGTFYDFAVLLLFVRNKEGSIFKIAENYLGKTAKYIFFILFILNISLLSFVFLRFFAKTIDGDGFLISALLFSQIFILILGGISRFVYISQGLMFLLSAIIGAVSVFIAYKFPIHFKFDEWIWYIVLIFYGFILSFVPVSLHFQTKGYLNSVFFLLIFTLIFFGVFRHGSDDFFSSAPFFVEENLFFLPLLFVGVSCGALSGFHSIFSLVSARQVSSECHISKIGFSSSILEGLFLIAFALIILGTIPKSLDEGFILSVSKPFSDFFPLSDKLFLFVILNFLLSSFESMIRALRFISEDFFVHDFQTKRIDLRFSLFIFLFLLIFSTFYFWRHDIEEAWYFLGVIGLTISLGFFIMLFQWFLKEFKNAFLLIFTFSAILFLFLISSWIVVVLGTKYFYGHGFSFLFIPSFVAISLIYMVSKLLFGFVYEKFRRSN